jgi:DNA-binding LacI/PurR family transcriptional regulator
MNVTRAEVAKRAGVSEATVSYVFSKGRIVSDKLTERVLKTAKELDYSPDMIARSMVIKKTKTIGVLTNDIGSPLQMEIIKGIQEEAMLNGYFVNVCGGTSNLELYIENFISRRVDGVFISVSSNLIKEEYIKKLADKGISVIMNTINDINDSRICGLENDMIQGLDKIVKYLTSLNHEKIAYLSTFNNEYYDYKKVTGFKFAMKKYHNNYNPCIYMEESTTDNDIDNGIKAASTLFNQKNDITAIICANDLMAYGVINALKEQNIKVPEDISVVGIDDIMFSKSFNPSLTTLSHCTHQYGNKIFDILYDNITDNKIVRSVFDSELIIRESCRRI